MSAFMDKMAGLAGGGGSSSNASPMNVGGGDPPVFTPPASAPSLSVGTTVADGASASPPKRTSPPTEPITSGRFGPTQGEAGQEPSSQAQAPGTASDAAIGGPPGSGSSKLEEKLDKLVDTMTQPKKPTLSDRLGEANRHLSQEQAETRISMSPHHHD
jgi:type IV secretion system protein TrbL